MPSDLSSPALKMGGSYLIARIKAQRIAPREFALASKGDIGYHLQEVLSSVSWIIFPFVMDIYKFIKHFEGYTQKLSYNPLFLESFVEQFAFLQ